MSLIKAYNNIKITSYLMFTKIKFWTNTKSLKTWYVLLILLYFTASYSVAHVFKSLHILYVIFQRDAKIIWCYLMIICLKNHVRRDLKIQIFIIWKGVERKMQKIGISPYLCIEIPITSQAKNVNALLTLFWDCKFFLISQHNGK